MSSLRSIFRLLLVAIATGLVLASQPTATATSLASPSAAPSMHNLAKADDTTTTAAVATATITRTPALPSTTAPYTATALFTSAILNSTNTYRRQHNASAMIWNTTLADFAVAYLANDTTCKFAHSGGPFGENIAIGFSTPQSAVEAWGNERTLYDFANPGFHENTGHFTQLVWKSTTTVGCARMFCGGTAAGQTNTGWFVACEYWPRGNVIGRFAQQVDRQTTTTPGGSKTGTNRPPTVSGGVVAAAVLLSGLLAVAFVWDVMDVVGRPVRA